MIYEEFRKIIKQERIFLILTILLSVNFLYPILLANTKGSQESLYREISDKFDGIPLQTAQDTIYLNQDISKAVLSDIEDQVNYSLSYAKNVSSKVNYLETNILGSDDIIKIYQYRIIKNFVYPKGIVTFLDQSFSTLLMQIYVIYIFSSIYAEDNMLEIQKSTSNYSKIVDAKIISHFLIVLFLVLIFLIFDLFSYQFNFHLKGLNSPLFALPEYGGTPLNITILGMIFLKYFGIFLGLSLTGLSVILTSLTSKNTNISLTFSFVFILTFNKIDLYQYSYLNPFSIFRLQNVVRFYNPIFNSLLEVYFLIVYVLLLVVTLIFIIKLVTKQGDNL